DDFKLVLFVMINFHDAFLAVENGAVVFFSIIGPGKGCVSETPFSGCQAAYQIVAYFYRLLVFIHFMQRSLKCAHLNNFIIEQIMQQVDFVDAKVSAYAKSGPLLFEKPGGLGLIDAPGFRPCMSECCTERQHLSKFPAG